MNKGLLIGGALAAYLLRDHIEHFLFGTPGAAAPAPAPPASSSSPAQQAFTPPPPVATDATGTRALLLEWAQKEPTYQANAGRMSAYQWDFMYKMARGVDAPAPDQMGIADPVMLISLDEYWTAATTHGLSGPGAAARRPAARPRPGAQSFARSAWGY